MPDPTDTFGLHRPDMGTTDWHVPLNENFETIDTVLAGLSSSSGATSGPWDTKLVGSNDIENPRPGLGEAIRAAIDNGRPCIDVRGAWSMGTGVKFSSASDTPATGSPPRRLPVIIDATGAIVEYTGSGWAFTNDCTGNVGGQIAGGRFELHGGVWANTGNATGFIRGIDVNFNEYLPQTTREFPIVYQPEIGNRWCESNVFGGQHHTPRIGIKAVSPRGVSFQDNYVRNIQLGIFREYAFDLSGNWNDCKFENPTCIAGGEGAAAFRNNGNLGGTTIDNLELEDATQGLDHYYVIKIGPDAAARGPDFDGGKHDFVRSKKNLEFVDPSNATGPWHVWLTETNRGAKHEYRICGDENGFGTQQCRIFDGNGHRVETADHPNNWL
ncbi:hypothetical protein ACFQE8_07945 [Salinirubellus sp. GCM10025818]|uniref:hypothetical protein n=1 Tax=Salinirubellus TaxID=2162630 RepID=UPI0030CFBE42